MFLLIVAVSILCMADGIFCSRIEKIHTKIDEVISSVPSLQSGKLIVASADFLRNRRDYADKVVPLVSSYADKVVPLVSEVLEGGYNQNGRPHHKPHGHKKRNYGQEGSGISQAVESYANGYGDTNGGGGYGITNAQGPKGEGGYGIPMKGYGNEGGGYGSMEGGYPDPVPEYGGGGYDDPMEHGGKGGGGYGTSVGGKGAGHGIIGGGYGETGSEEFGTGYGIMEERIPPIKGDGYGPKNAGNGKYTSVGG